MKIVGHNYSQLHPQRMKSDIKDYMIYDSTYYITFKKQAKLLLVFKVRIVITFGESCEKSWTCLSL